MTTRSFQELTHYHRDLEHVLEEARDALRTGWNEELEELLDDFETGMRVLLVEETHVLLPAFSKRAHGKDVRALTVEELGLLHAMRAVREAVHARRRATGENIPDGPDTPAARAERDLAAALAQLEEALTLFSVRRANGLYGTLDHVLPAAERSQLLSKCSIRLGWPPDEMLGDQRPA